MLIFSRKNMKPELMEGAPPGAILYCHPSSWIQQHICTQWFEHFLRFAKPTNEDPAVLVLDGHYSHTRNLDVIDMVRENHVSLVCLPPHSTHRMQSLDVASMRPFETHCTQEINTWLRNHPGRAVTHYQIAGLMGKAYLRAASAKTAVNGFRKTGICSMNRHVFREPFLVENLQHLRLSQTGLLSSYQLFFTQHTSVRCLHYRTHHKQLQEIWGVKHHCLWAVLHVEASWKRANPTSPQWNLRNKKE
jgi:hypothetical protein